MRLLLTGVTGVAGLAIYRAALRDPDISKITVLSRRPIPGWAKLPGNASEKTEVVIHTDFLSYPTELAKRLAANDACIWALGRGSSGFTEQEYTTITYEYPLAALRALKSSGAGEGKGPENPFRFLYISGEAADPTEKSFMMWARVKGRAEKDITAFCDASEGMEAHIYRPAYFFPSKEYPADILNQRSTFDRIKNFVVAPLVSTLWPAGFTPIDDLGRFCVDVVKGHWSHQGMFSNKQMRELITQV
ncbi:hypothetical protein B0H21DRAFT_817644 [Amylocystis lapponica]|nr:hypothetical protein B0H21DRAFT_817644 [Amylocystis lapponica]